MLETINWSDAAVIAAMIGGTFALAKELVAFSFRIVERVMTEHRKRVTIKARLAQLHFQNAVDCVRVLSAWEAGIEAQKAYGLLVGPQPPPVHFLRYEDATLQQDSVILADELPDAVTGLLKVHEAREAILAAFDAETRAVEGTSVYYTFPRTRRLVHGLGENSLLYLDAISKSLPHKSFSLNGGARNAFLRATKNLRSALSEHTMVSQKDMEAEVLYANEQVALIRARTTGA